MPLGITQCYLPPGRGDIPAVTAAEAGTQFSDPGGCKAEVAYDWRKHGVKKVMATGTHNLDLWRVLYLFSNVQVVICQKFRRFS